MFDKFKQGPEKLLRRIEQMRQMALAVWNLRGDSYIKVKRTTDSVRLSLDVNQLLPRIPKGSVYATRIRSAFCKTDAGSNSTIVCYLDTDTTGDEITVNCVICGGTALNEAFPRLADGTRLFVFNDDDTWRALQIFQASETC